MSSMLNMNTKLEEAFLPQGFTNLMKAWDKFNIHEHSASHRFAIMQLQQTKAAPIDAQLSKQKAAEQTAARAALCEVFSLSNIWKDKVLPYVAVI
jgi:hypothetical protein